MRKESGMGNGERGMEGGGVYSDGGKSNPDIHGIHGNARLGRHGKAWKKERLYCIWEGLKKSQMDYSASFGLECRKGAECLG